MRVNRRNQTNEDFRVSLCTEAMKPHGSGVETAGMKSLFHDLGHFLLALSRFKNWTTTADIT